MQLDMEQDEIPLSRDDREERRDDHIEDRMERRDDRMERRDDRMERREDRRDDGPPALEECKLFIGNLSWNTTDATLGEAFAVHGTVIDSRVVTDKFSGKSRGFGFIEYEDAASAETALIAMNGMDVDGRPVRVDRANKRRPAQRRSSTYY